jgi:hypothetical protein
VVQKDPNLEVQQRIELVFATFLKMRSARQVVRTFRAQGLALPRRNRFGDVLWREPSIAAILSMLKNPAYAGAFVYGRTRTVRTGPGPEQAFQKVLPLDQWRIRVNDQYPADISWETDERIRAMLQDNYAEYDRHKTRGTPRPGRARLAWTHVTRGECGHKMVVQSKGSPRYICNYLRQQYRVPVCQYLPTDPIDARVVEAFFAALSPVQARPLRAGHGELPPSGRGHAPRPSEPSGAPALPSRSWLCANSCRSTRTTGWSPLSWSGAGRQHCVRSDRPKTLMLKHPHRPQPRSCLRS